jgi:hypothetical protein
MIQRKQTMSRGQTQSTEKLITLTPTNIIV